MHKSKVTSTMAIEALIRTSQSYVQRHWRLIFVLMLVLLHLASMRGPGDLWTRGLMLAHFGLFILWQPFMRGEQRLSGLQTLGIVAISAGILLFLNWWMLGLWLSIFAGIVGGKVFLFQARWLRRFYLLALAYLVTLLLVWVVPSMFFGGTPVLELELFVMFGLPLIFLAMAFMPTEQDTVETPQIVDFFYATLLFLLFAVLVLGTLAFMRVGNLPYATSLTYSILIIAVVLLLLSLAWNPRAGFAGLSMYFSRYLLSIGLPFEHWLYFLAELSQMESRPDRFLKEACAGLARLPWVTGGFWHTSNESGDFGAVSKNSVEHTNPEIHLRVFTRSPLSPSLVWHFHLLGQLLGEFYIAKIREQKLQQQTYVQAVHETGARMTHDVKNLLQSLNVLCSAVEREASSDPQEIAALVRRQLPVISQRLQQTLDKLQKPQTDTGSFVQAKIWWDGFKRIYGSRGVEFHEHDIEEGVFLPKELFDSAGDNLMQNALRKRKTDELVTIRASFSCREAVEFSVFDSGDAVAAEVLQGLLRGPVPSQTGYGIGLYQSSRLAEISGFSLSLSQNERGRVCFTLRGDVRGSRRQPVERS